MKAQCKLRICSVRVISKARIETSPPEFSWLQPFAARATLTAFLIRSTSRGSLVLTCCQAPLLMRAPLSGGHPQFVFKARPASDFRCLKGPASRCVLGEWENQQLVFYALDPIRGKGQELARQEIASGPEIAESNWDISPDGSRLALAIPEGPPARIRILSWPAARGKISA